MDKKEIIQQITPVFLRNGYRSLTMDDVANELGMSKKTLYVFFDSKEKLVKEVVAYAGETIQNVMAEIQSQDFGAIEEFLSIRRKVQEIFTGNEQQRCVTELKRFFPKIYKTSYSKQLDVVFVNIKNNIIKGKANQEYRSDIDEDKMTQMLITVLMGLKTTDIKLTNEEFERINTTFFDVYIRGISTSKGIKIYEKLTK